MSLQTTTFDFQNNCQLANISILTHVDILFTDFKQNESLITSKSAVMKLDAQGGIKRNLNNPIEKDNIMMPVGGWAVVRFNATNPGKKLTFNSFLSTNQILL